MLHIQNNFVKMLKLLFMSFHMDIIVIFMLRYQRVLFRRVIWDALVIRMRKGKEILHYQFTPKF